MHVCERIFIHKNYENSKLYVFHMVHGTKGPWYEQSMVRIIYGTNSQWYEKHSNRLSTVGKQALPVSGATVWNDLPVHVASAPSLVVFRQRLETFLFSRSYQDIRPII